MDHNGHDLESNDPLGQRPPGVVTGYFTVAYRTAVGKWFWECNIGNISTQGGPYSSQSAANLGLLYALSLVLMEGVRDESLSSLSQVGQPSSEV